MRTLQTARNQWLNAYYSGDYQLLHHLETKDFYIEENQQILPTALRYQQIESLVKQGKWQPQRLVEKELQFIQISDTEYQVTGVAYSAALQLRIQEYWQLENEQWRVTGLQITSL